MSDSYTTLNSGSGGDLIDDELVTTGAGTVKRQRIEVCGSGASEITRVISSAPTGSEYAAVTRPITTTSSFVTGRQNSVTTTATQMTSTSTATINGVQVIAADTNTDKIYLGGSGVTANSANSTDGFPLAPGDSLFVPVSNADLIYLIAASGTQVAFFFGC